MRQPRQREERSAVTKPFGISKRLIWEAFKCVKANDGAAGVDRESIEKFESDLHNNLYKLWNRMCSGSYFPPPIKAVPIPKKSGGVRILGVPTVADRVAQTAAKLLLEPELEPLFHDDSYGYRPGRSALDAVGIVRRRCWKFDWVVEFDIKGLFDNIDHELLLRALRRHCREAWVLLYVERWLTAPMQSEDGTLTPRSRGTPQGGVISPILANLFLYYAFDAWLSKELTSVRFCRYADDGVVHCKSLAQARYALARIGDRLRQCGLELHPDKTHIVYCQDINRRADHPVVQFTFLGYTFRPRKAVDKYGRVYVNFAPAVSRDALRTMRQTIRGWHLQLRTDCELADLSARFNAILRGWYGYYARFHASTMSAVWLHMNDYLVRWLMRKYKFLARHKRRAWQALAKLGNANKNAFVHWALGCLPSVG